MAGQPGRSGGAREGAGRKPTREKFEQEVDAAEALIAASLPEIVKALKVVAKGGKRVVEIYRPSGTVLGEQTLTYNNGQPMIGSNNKPLMGKAPLYKNTEPTDMVLAERQIIHEGPDRTACKDLLERILGKPAPPPPAVKEEDSGAEGLGELRRFLGVDDGDGNGTGDDGDREGS